MNDYQCLQDRHAALCAVLAALSDPGRLKILRRIWFSEEPLPTGKVHVGFSQPMMTHHVRALHEAGLVRRTRNGAQWLLDREPDCAFSALVDRVLEIA